MLKMPGTALPKRIFRPFAYLSHEGLNEKQYKLASAHDKKEVIGTLGVAWRIILITGVAILFMVLISGSSIKEWNDTAPAFFPIFTGLVVFLFLLEVIAKYIKPKKYKIFNREDGTVSIPKVFFQGDRLKAPWGEFEGRITVDSSITGVPQHVLLLMHVPSRKGWHLDVSNLGVDSILRYWSFLVQYMDKTKPLPDVPELHHCGDLEKGYGSWEDWEQYIKKNSDPYDEWISELNDNPMLDRVNAPYYEEKTKQEQELAKADKHKPQGQNNTYI